MDALDHIWTSLEGPEPGSPAPMSVTSAGTALMFQIRSVSGRSRDERTLVATSTTGMTAELHFERDRLKKSIKVRGHLTNEGDHAVAIERASTISLWLDFAPQQAGTTIRTWLGTRFLANYFPPSDFESRDRHLAQMTGLFTPLSVHGGGDGRSSSADLSFMLAAAAGSGFGCAVEWSGTWFMSAMQDSHSSSSYREGYRFDAGLWGIQLELAPADSIPLPTVHLVGYDGGLDAGQNALRRYVRTELTPLLNGQEVLPPVSFNTFAALGNDYSADLLGPAVNSAAAVGFEYFVVDGGWHTGGFRKGIGNWTSPDPEKFPEGLREFAHSVREAGMQFGLWFEPEFAHRSSSIAVAHPDWILEGPTISPYDSPTNFMYGEWDHEYVALDFGLEAVQAYWIDTITRAYRRWGVRWIRWDSNQQLMPFWDLTSSRGLAQIGHIEGLYRVWDYLLSEFPDLLIEQCATGGHRIDAGTVRRGHTFWMNDHTVTSDVVRRLQTRLNQVLPGNFANTNLAQPRHDFNDYDFLSHSAGAFGYSGRLWESTGPQLGSMASAIERYKRFRPILLGDYHAEVELPNDPHAFEAHEWSDGDRSVRFEFNAKPGLATVQIAGPLR